MSKKDIEIFIRIKETEALGDIGSANEISILTTLSSQSDGYLTLRTSSSIKKIQGRIGYYNCEYVTDEINKQTLKSKEVIILHLSDLHFGTDDDALNWASTLIDDLKRDMHIDKIDIVIISGDIGNFSEENEYNSACSFLKRIIREYSLDVKNLIIVPGNHDLNWEISNKSCKEDEKEEFIISNRNLYNSRFRHFMDFYRKIKGEPYPENPDKQGTVHRFEDLGITVVGLNSAYNIDHINTQSSDINPSAVSHVLDGLRDYDDRYLKIAVWHHPLRGDGYIKDTGFLERLSVAGFRLAMHGHMHMEQNDIFQYDKGEKGRKIKIIGAGTFSAKTSDLPTAYPWEYNLIKIKDGIAEVYTRQRQKQTGAWKLYATWTLELGKS